MAGEATSSGGIFEGDPKFAAAAEDLRVNEADGIIESWVDPSIDSVVKEKTIETLWRIVEKHGVVPAEEAVIQLLDVIEKRVPVHWEMDKARQPESSPEED